MDLLKPSPANSSPLTPLGFLERAATVYGNCTSIIYNKTTYTWTQTHRRCLQLASALKLIIGIGRGDVVSVLSPNLPAMYELHFAVPMSGAILNNINTRLDARTISLILRHSESKLVFVDILSRSTILQALSLFPPETNPPILVFINDDDETENSSSAVESGQDLTYEDLIKKGDPNFKWVRPESEWDPMVLNYTSGTTSSPKGVVHPHRGLFTMTVDSLINWSVPKQPVYLWTLAMFHANGWSFTWGMAAVGGTNICLRKFDAATVYSLIRQHNVTHMCGAPVVLNMLANEPGKEPLQNPVQILTAGAPPPAPVLFRIESLGFIVSHGYGLTETAGLVVSCAWKPEWNRLAATERARLKARQGVRTAATAEIDVLDVDSGLSVKRDGSSLGEVVLRGGTVMLGYFKDPTGTSNCLKENGWFYTGDVGVMHPDGYLEIKDRSKDVIISGGENLSSVEVESVLYSHPAINEAAVVARPDEFWGETPCAFVSLKSESNRPSENEIIEFCRNRLPHYMVPKTVVYKEELPKTATGKIQKFLLRDMAKVLGAPRTTPALKFRGPYTKTENMALSYVFTKNTRSLVFL
ncbi:AMP-dependent synthetase/ligase [Macleaya cordata]|uniref:AMP-dependent synthetase/ligase n=1 Tax=Macleaya cordata TaxID=56857 RepID=A0A200RCS7_MACCD|nr:AMP-dependent synthetase/ligase [Macleaya cordata]OVA20519.1 AMP-dependent synthetase/ligase [Macleaya cordata]